MESDGAAAAPFARVEDFISEVVMEMRKPVLWAGAAALIASFFYTATSMKEDRDAAQLRPAASDLFSFIKPSIDVTAQEEMPAVQKPDRMPANSQQAEQDSAAIPFTPTLVAEVEASVQAMRKQGASDDEIYRRRAAMLSAASASQLADMERQEASWQARVGAYLAERNRLFDSVVQFSGIDRENALRQLRDARFTTDEQVLLSAHESSSVPTLPLP